MIVATFPRTGATKFCIDLAAKHNMPFIGELSPVYSPELGDNGYPDKKTKHEVPNCQPQPTLEMFTKYMDTEDCVKQINRYAYLVVDKADYILLRRDFYHVGESLVGLLTRSGLPHDGGFPAFIAIMLQEIFCETAALTAWCVEHPERKITWFEDYFPEYDEWSEAHKERNVKIHPGWHKWLAHHIGQTPIQKHLDILWDRTH